MLKMKRYEDKMASNLFPKFSGILSFYSKMINE